VCPRTLFWRYKSNVGGNSSGQLQAAVRSGDWKYLRQGEKEYLFNLANDKGEQTDLKDNNPKVLQRLRVKLAAPPAIAFRNGMAKSCLTQHQEKSFMQERTVDTSTCHIGFRYVVNV
jgi:arylsulfatase A-like enzyme